MGMKVVVGMLALASQCSAHDIRPRLRSSSSKHQSSQSALSASLQASQAPLVPSAPLPASDKAAIALLLLLYTLQGIPMGLGSALPMLMLERGVGTMEQAIFSTVALPFAVKLGWAPLVDSLYLPFFGRRKTWIVPMQALIGLLLISSGGRVDALLGPVGASTPVNVKALTGLFVTFYVLAATQDIAVDGLALTVLSAPNRELGATCNAIGQTLGTFLAYVGFILLHSKNLVTLGQFMRLWGWLFVGSIAAVISMARRDEYTQPVGGSVRTMLSTYAEMAKVVSLPAVRGLAGVLLTCRMPFAAFDLALPLELQKNGVQKEELAAVAIMLLPLSMAAQAAVSRFFRSGATPMRLFYSSYCVKIAQGALATGLIVLLKTCKAADGRIPLWLYAAGLVVLALGAVASASMFVAQMAFFNRVSDARIGGTYLTMLNTLANLGAQWPGTVVLAAKGAIERTPGAPDSFYVVAAASVLLGTGWAYVMRRRIFALQQQPPQSWLAADSDAAPLRSTSGRPRAGWLPMAASKTDK